MKLKVLTILGTRPEIVRLSRIISKLNIFFDHVLVNTGQNYDTNLSSIFFKELKLRRPDYDLNCKNKNSVEFISEVLVKIDSVLLKEKPDAVLVLGDTNSALSVLVAKKRQIPIFHIEAGNRCFDLRVPEEINRSLIDKISDINMLSNQHAYLPLQQMYGSFSQGGQYHLDNIIKFRGFKNLGNNCVRSVRKRGEYGKNN